MKGSPHRRGDTDKKATDGNVGMRTRARSSVPARLAGLLLLVVLSLTGCVEVRMVDTTPPAGPPESQAGPVSADDVVHDLSILAVDFDPPLDYQHLIVLRKPISLLVAVENLGSETERNVTVKADLSSPEDSRMLISAEAKLETIAPGEIQIVRFPGLENVPYHQSYHLEVAVGPTQGESRLNDNQKAFEIEIHRQPDKP